MIRLSRVTKLDGVRSWSTPAGTTCPGSFNPDGSLVDACSGCYAKSGNYHRPNVKYPREENHQDWKRDGWVDDMVNELFYDRFFRWFDSGDIYHPEQARKILEVIRRTDWVLHWLPTRSYKRPKIRPILEDINQLPNVAVRYSSDSVTGEYEPHHGSTIIPHPETDDPNLTVCEAYANKEGKCNRCIKCWDKSIPIIAYVAHGRSMKALIRRKGIAIA